jgi:hypothetical protein
MKIREMLFGASVVAVMGCGLILAQTSSAPATKPAATASAATATAAATKPSAAPTCVKCHPFDKVIETSKDWKTPGGDKVNPHIYIPHSSKKAEDMPDCLKCHKEHSMPPKEGEVDLKKMDVQWCYDACHHEKNFVKCDKCH